ncbi:MAG: biotin-dependent carboxyltransferase [Dehalococcoidia bacterium]|nr:biotin-dependent carboxyltransferase [Dehalococcoidia bacterium]MSQ34847.1 biotin-dependent carboxyltransferase [Dehalococcoidia bacterium]
MTEAVLKVLSPGARSLIQDMGRPGFQRFGVSISGAMDTEALLLGNRLAGNNVDAAGIEVLLGNAEFEFSHQAIFAVTGGDLAPTLDGKPVPAWQSLTAFPGERLMFGMASEGVRAYLCVAGGIATEPVLGSRSTHAGSRLGGLRGRPLEAGDELALGLADPDGEAASGLRVPASLLPVHADEFTVRVVRGPQEDSFNEAGVRTFYGSTYTVTERSDRQGLRLDGPLIEARGGRHDIVSDAVVAGSIQVPGDAMPIILMADRQTTGGYAKIAVAASIDRPLLAQAAPGARVRFVQTTVKEAQLAATTRRKALTETPLELAGEARELRLKIEGQTYRLRTGLRDGDVESGAVAVRIDGREATLVRVRRV